jgi:hypothetical protein
MPTAREYEDEIERQQRTNQDLFSQLANIKSQVVTLEDIEKMEQNYIHASNYQFRRENERFSWLTDLLCAIRKYLGIEDKKYGLSSLIDRAKNKKLILLLDALQIFYSRMDLDDR